MYPYSLQSSFPEAQIFISAYAIIDRFYWQIWMQQTAVTLSHTHTHTHTQRFTNSHSTLLYLLQASRKKGGEKTRNLAESFLRLSSGILHLSSKAISSQCAERIKTQWYPLLLHDTEIKYLSINSHEPTVDLMVFRIWLSLNPKCP